MAQAVQAAMASLKERTKKIAIKAKSRSNARGDCIKDRIARREPLVIATAILPTMTTDIHSSSLLLCLLRSSRNPRPTQKLQRASNQEEGSGLNVHCSLALMSK